MSAALVYDGECPFCRNYVGLLRLREKFPGIELVDARNDPCHPAIKAAVAAGLMIDDGMVLVDGDRILYADEVVHEIATRDSGLNAAIFSSSKRARRLYPWMRRGRAAILKLLGKKKLGF